MRTDEEIKDAITKLQTLYSAPGKQIGGFRYNHETRKVFKEQMDVLLERKSEDDIERELHVDEQDEEYSDGDNDLYFEAMRAHAWMMGEDEEVDWEEEWTHLQTTLQEAKK